MTTRYSLLQKRVLNASAESIWDAWTKPNLLKQWFCPLGMKAIGAEANLSIGGKYRIVMDASGAAMRPPPEMGDILTAYGSYQQIEPHHKLVFSWAWEGRDEISRVTITLTPKGNTTVLVLEHDGLMDEASSIFHEDGWVPTLDNLSRHLELHDTRNGYQ